MNEKTIAVLSKLNEESFLLDIPKWILCFLLKETSTYIKTIHGECKEKFKIKVLQ